MKHEKSGNKMKWLLCLVLLAGCFLLGHPQQTYADAQPEYTKFDQLNGRIVAMLTGAPTRI